MSIDWCEEAQTLNDAYYEVVDERDSARRERDEALAKVRELQTYAFANGLYKFCDVDHLPPLVRFAMGKAVKQVFAEWQAAGSPSDVPTLKALFPREG